jgi:hypothetical protein
VLISDSDSPPPGPGNILSTLSPEELEAAKKAALIRQYAYLDATPEEIAAVEGRDPSAPLKGMDSAEKKKAEERRKAIEEAIRLDGRKKKHRKKKEGELDDHEYPGGEKLIAVDLLAPNLNRDKVIYQQQVEREAAKAAATEKKNRDKAALEKQRYVSASRYLWFAKLIVERTLRKPKQINRRKQQSKNDEPKLVDSQSVSAMHLATTVRRSVCSTRQ